MGRFASKKIKGSFSGDETKRATDAITDAPPTTTTTTTTSSRAS
jgi:hypothetical protein